MIWAISALRSRPVAPAVRVVVVVRVAPPAFLNTWGWTTLVRSTVLTAVTWGTAWVRVVTVRREAVASLTAAEMEGWRAVTIWAMRALWSRPEEEEEAVVTCLLVLKAAALLLLLLKVLVVVVALLMAAALLLLLLATAVIFFTAATGRLLTSTKPSCFS